MKAIEVIVIIVLSIVFGVFLLLYIYEYVVGLYTQDDIQPKISVEHNLIDKFNSSNELKLLTFNVWGLPIWLPKIDKISRYNIMPDQIASLNCDIICLQESFDPKIRRKIIKKMQDLGYMFNKDYHCNTSAFLIFKKDCFGGLMTFSKFPIEREYFFHHKFYKEMKSDERKGVKGFLLTEINSPWGKLIVINIHLYSGRTPKDEEMRMKQIRFLNKTLDSLGYANNKIVLQGDLNVVHPYLSSIDSSKYRKSLVYDFILDDMKFHDTQGQITFGDLSYDPLNNFYAGTFYNRYENRQKFDYCLYKFPNVEKLISSGTVVFKMPRPISDHFGILTVIQMN